MKCPRCQAENLEERVYCWKCFAPLRSGAMGTSPVVAATASVAPPLSTTTARKPPVALLVLVGAVVLAAIAIAVAAVLISRNSPQKVAHTFAEALVGKDEATLRRVAAAKDVDRVPRIVGFAGMFPDLKLEVTRVEDRGGQKVAVLSATFSQITFGAKRFSVPNGKLELPFVLTRERWFFWRVDLERSEALLRQQLQQAAADYLRQNPALMQQWLQQMTQGAPSLPK